MKSYSKEELEFVQNNQGLVTFVQADARKLNNMKVVTATGQELQIMGNVDVIHEKHAIMHAHTPDYALPRLGSLLSKQGTFLLYTNSYRMHRSPAGSAYDESRSEAFTNGIKNMINFAHLKEQKSKHARGYAVYAKRKAPKMVA